LNTVVGRSGGFETLQLGGSVVGRGSIVGRPVAGLRVGSSRAGGDSFVG
jgi:hypothetical protein